MALFSPFCHPRLDRGSRVFAFSCLCEENDAGSSITNVEDDRKRKDKDKDNDTGSPIKNVEDDRKSVEDDRRRKDKDKNNDTGSSRAQG